MRFNENVNNAFYSEDFMTIPDYCNISKSSIEDLVGKTITDIKWGDSDFFIKCVDKDLEISYYHLYHEQDCCEGVWLDEIVGDLNDLINTSVIKAVEKISSDDNIKPKKNGPVRVPLILPDDSHTWTFYTIATINGYVDLRWIGTSNGYYSESISITKYSE